MQQRGIGPSTLDALFAYGAGAHDGRGAVVWYFDKHARRQLRRKCDARLYKSIERHLSAYAVVGSDGAVVTVGHRTHRIARD
jgi:hypothetical protein